MTPTRIGSNYPIKSTGSGPGQDCQPRGEAQMEDARTSTSSQRLASTFETLIESAEAYITAIPVEWELLPSLWIGTMNSYLQVKKLMGPEKTEELLRDWKPTSCKGQVQQIKAWLKNQGMFSEYQKKRLAQGKDNSPVDNPQASTSKNPPQQVLNKGKQPPKNNQNGKQKANGKAKCKWSQPHSQNYQIPKKEKTAKDNVFNMARTLMEFKNEEEESINQSFPKE
ncbi:hypothetical protein O181_031036 [Austropuccinia psidii MF-1]|uniref:Uncharacterized protein n=1 Tax=Austropuccinia psidii MF-1 TaxID=1389203 RepID=A0A9Q3H4T6_9BASI|nr:hypothetical protein [Austropuccinia psidii MF-1]